MRGSEKRLRLPTAPGVPAVRRAVSAADQARLVAPVVSPRVAFLLLAGVALVWGAHWPIMKLGLEDMPPLTYAALRVGSGLATLVAVLAATRALRLPPRHDLRVVLAVGLGQVAAAIALTNVALLVAPPGRASILLYTMPLWVAAIQALVLRAALSRREALGLALGAVGIVLLVSRASLDWRSAAGLLSVGCLLSAAVVWAVTTILVRRHEWTATPLELQPWQLALALVPLGVFALALEHGQPVHWQPRTVAVLAFSGPVATGFAYWASQSASRTLTPLATTGAMLAIPIVGISSSALLLGEPVGPSDIVAFGIALAGIALVTLHGHGALEPAPTRPADPLPHRVSARQETAR